MVFRIIETIFDSRAGLAVSSPVFGLVHLANDGETLAGITSIAIVFGPLLDRALYARQTSLDGYWPAYSLELHDGEDFLGQRVRHGRRAGAVQDYLRRPGIAHWRQCGHGGLADRHPGICHGQHTHADPGSPARQQPTAPLETPEWLTGL